MGDEQAVMKVLAERGLLLVQDKELPSVVGLLLRGSLATSWWGHPDAQRVFDALTALGDRDDVLITKLLHGKDTLVHRTLWSALSTVGSAREPWQLASLPAASTKLLREVGRARAPVQATGAAAKPLLLRLLVVSREVHTESGAHATALESWEAWSKRVGCRPARSVAAARAAIEAAAAALGAPPRALPWNGPAR
jgi:hypothetical protein